MNLPPPNTPDQPPITADEPKSAFVQRGFTEIAHVYDLYNNLITFGLHKVWKKKAVGLALKNNPRTLLDACCGTGDIALLVAKYGQKLGNPPTVIGLDFSEKMIAVARHKNNCRSNPEFRVADFMQNGLADGSFDAVTIGFGLRNLESVDGGLSEMHRLLRVGGTVTVLDMGRIKAPVLDKLFALYFFRIVPIIGKILLRKTKLFDYFPQSTVTYPDPALLAQKLSNNGFTSVRITYLGLGSVTLHTAVKAAVA